MNSGPGIRSLGGHGQEHQELLYWVALAVFVLVVSVLIALYRRNRARLEMEEVDAILRGEDIL